MNLYKHYLASPEGRTGVVRDPTSKLSDTEVAYADIFDELAERGRFDEQGGYLSDEDWADSQ